MNTNSVNSVREVNSVYSTTNNGAKEILFSGISDDDDIVNDIHSINNNVFF